MKKLFVMDKVKFIDFLKTKGLKLTKERQNIINEISQSDGHFDPEELYTKLQSKGLKVSRASVYRTIPLLIQSGILQEVQLSENRAHYEKRSETKHHDHMICLICGKIIEFYSPTLEMLQDEICAKEEFKGIRHNLEIYGMCKDCG